MSRFSRSGSNATAPISGGPRTPPSTRRSAPSSVRSTPAQRSASSTAGATRRRAASPRSSCSTSSPETSTREDPRAFACDGMALALAQEAVRVRADRAVLGEGRKFFYMPYEHSESPRIHEIAVTLFESLDDPESLKYELQHKGDHRPLRALSAPQQALSRPSTTEEIAFLKTPNSSSARASARVDAHPGGGMLRALFGATARHRTRGPCLPRWLTGAHRASNMRTWRTPSVPFRWMRWSRPAPVIPACR